jgi:hypothetical protein
MATLSLTPDPVAGDTTVLPVDRVLHGHLLFTTVLPGTDVTITYGQHDIWLEFDPTTGGTGAETRDFPDLSNNTPILLAFSARLQLDPTEPLESE